MEKKSTCTSFYAYEMVRRVDQSRQKLSEPIMTVISLLVPGLQFINGRLELLNGGEGFHDLFEQESIKYADSLNTQSKYKEWLSVSTSFSVCVYVCVCVCVGGGGGKKEQCFS